MQNNQNEFRVLARDMAEVLSEQEIEQVAGGGCTTTTKVTWTEKTGSDVEVSVTCTTG